MRKLHQLIAFCVAVALAPVALVAQQRGTVQGTVVNATTQQPLAGVQVTVAGTQIGTVTGEQGRYELFNVPTGQQTILAQRVGYGADQEVVMVPEGGIVTAALALQEEALALEGIVVTALGVQREERALGVAVQDIQGEELTEARETNIVNALSGKIAGVNVVGAGPQGGSSRIVIRGANSIAGNNEPLFIVDGIPINNSANTNSGYGGSSGEGAFDYGNAAADINPNDIASVTVLKGPNAAALYGSRAANGAVIITTKKGQGARGTQVTFNSNVTWEDPLRLPDYQNQYGQGLFGKFAFVDGQGGGTFDGVDESWGPKLDAGLMIPQFFSDGEPAPWVSNPNNVRNFFETGRTVTNNLSLATSSDRANMRLSVTNLNQQGMYPSQEMDRWTVALAGAGNVTDRLSADASVNYIRQNAENRPGTGYDESNIMQQFVWFGRQVDTNKLRNYKLEDTPLGAGGTPYNWNYNYHANPFWIAYENNNFDSRDRIIGQASTTYEFTDWLKGMARAGTDTYTDRRKRTYATGFDVAFPRGAFGSNVIERGETNIDFLLTAERPISDDIEITANFGGNRRYNQTDFNSTFVEELSVPGIYSVGNAAVTPISSDGVFKKQVNSLYGSAQVGFRDYVFVDMTGRNDWSSTLPEGNNSYFYPSVSTSFVFTDAFNLNSPLLSFGKVRASWARVGNDAEPYQLTAVFSAQNPFGGVPLYAVPNTLPNVDLRPEETESWEFGTDLRFFGQRLGVDATYYNAITRNQILEAQISAASGFTGQVLNAGAIRNKGFEVLVDVTPVVLDNGFQWDVTATYAQNESEVVELFGDLETLVLGGRDYWGVTAEARLGEPYGQLYGTGYLRDCNRDAAGSCMLDGDGNPVRDRSNPIVVGSSGLPLRSTEKVLLGNYNSDWTGSLSNQISYGGLQFSFLLDTRQGGSLFSVTNYFGKYAGVLEETLVGRCVEGDPTGGLPTCTPETGIIVDGVTTDGTPNTTVVSGQDYFGGLYGIQESSIYDASFVKLREMRLGYRVPDSLIRRLPVSGINVALVGRNLALWTDIPHLDPETAFDTSNRQGFEFGQLPTARSIGFNVVITP